MHTNFIRFIFSQLLLITISSLCLQAQTPFVTFFEITESGEKRNVPQDFIKYSSDINSVISVDFNANEFAINNDLMLFSEECESLKAEMDSLNKILTEVNKLPLLVKEIANLKAQLIKNEERGTEDEFRKRLREHGKIMDEVISYFERVNYDGLTEALSSNSYSPLGSLLSDRINLINEQLKSETLKLITDDSLRIRAWCIQQSRGKKPNAIHLEHYDNLSMGSLQLIDKVTMARTEEEEAHLQNSLKFHDDLKNFIVDMSKGESEIRQTFKKFKENFFSDLEDFRNLFGTNVIENLLNELNQEINDSPVRDELQQLQGEVIKVKSDLKEFFELKKEQTLIVDSIKSVVQPDPLLFFTAIKKLLDKFRKFKDDLESIANSSRINDIENNINELIAAMESRLHIFSLNIQNQFKDFIENKKQAWINRFKNVDEILSKYGSLKDGFKEIVQSVAFISNVKKNIADPGTLIPEDIQDVLFADVKPTEIGISSTNREEGDIFKLYVQVLRKGPPISNLEYEFRIKKYGWYTAWVGSLVFIKGNWHDSFQPGTSASWILHYRSRPENDASSGGGILGDIINLGIGINSVVFSTDKNIEFGLGGVVTFLNDILQFGVGFNFQQDKPYLQVGASFLNVPQP